MSAPPLVSVALDLLGPSLGLSGLSLGLRRAFLDPFLRPWPPSLKTLVPRVPDHGSHFPLQQQTHTLGHFNSHRRQAPGHRDEVKGRVLKVPASGSLVSVEVA